MHRSCVVGARIATSAAAVAGLIVIQFATMRSSYAANGSVVAVDGTPTPVAGLAGTGQPQLVPTLTATAGLPGQALPGLPGQTPPAASASQQASDRIAAVSQQVADAVHDPSLPIDTKVERINALATQFNQLVAQWQQQLPQTAAATSPFGAGASPQATPSGTTTPVPSSPAALVPTPPANGQAPAGAPSADQLRSQIAAISQQMAQIAADPSLSTDSRTTLLAALAAQFNQLMLQLQQLGG